MSNPKTCGQCKHCDVVHMPVPTGLCWGIFATLDGEVMPYWNPKREDVLMFVDLDNSLATECACFEECKEGAE